MRGRDGKCLSLYSYPTHAPPYARKAFRLLASSTAVLHLLTRSVPIGTHRMLWRPRHRPAAVCWPSEPRSSRFLRYCLLLLRDPRSPGACQCSLNAHKRNVGPAKEQVKRNQAPGLTRRLACCHRQPGRVPAVPSRRQLCLEEQQPAETTPFEPPSPGWTN